MKDFNASRCPLDPDNYWVDDDTGERVHAPNGERTVAPVYVAMLCSALMEQAERVERIERIERITTLEEAAAYVKAQARDQGEVMNKRPSPPVANYDDEAEPSGERTGRLAYVSNLARQEAMRAALYHSDCEIKVRDDGIYGNAEATLWKIRGVPKTFYPTKMAAEVAARAHFPHDSPIVRYSRISFVEINFEYEEDPC